MKKRHYALLDRDGTIIAERHYLSDPDEVELLPAAISGLRRLSDLGLGLIVVTNQSAVGRGFFDNARLLQIHQRMCDLLETHGIILDGIYSCIHTPENRCSCRKPNPGLAELAARELGFNLKNSFVIGDKVCDVELGRRVEATTFLVRTGYGAEVAQGRRAAPDYIVDDLSEAARIIQGLLSGAERRMSDDY